MYNCACLCLLAGPSEAFRGTQLVAKKRTAVLGERKAAMKARAVKMILLAVAIGIAITAGVVAIPQR